MSNLLEQQFQQCFRRSFGWLMLNFAFVGILVCAHCQPVSAQTTIDKPTGSSHRSHRAAGINAIPFAKINATAQKRIKDVVNRPSFYRRLPVQTIDADPDYFRLLVRRPELIVSIWQLMGVTQMSTERTGPFSVKTNDGAGTISDLELIYGNDNLHVFYGNGSYTGPMLRQKLTGRCVIVLQTQAKETATGYELTNVLDIYLRVDNATASLITRTIQPLVGSTADHNFTESLKFVQRLNESTRANGPGVKGMGRKLKIDDQVRIDFDNVVDQVYERASKKRQQAQRGTAPPKQVAQIQKSSRQRTNQSRTAQPPSNNVTPQVQAAKPALTSPPQTRQQPFVSPSMVSQSSRARNRSASQVAKDTNSASGPQISQNTSAAKTAEPVKLTLTDTLSRPGISVLEGGPRDLTETAKPFVSVADSSKVTNPAFVPNRFPKQSTQR